MWPPMSLRLVHSLRMRLRAQEWILAPSRILDETIVAPIVVVGMMRSGTTLLRPGRRSRAVGAANLAA